MKAKVLVRGEAKGPVLFLGDRLSFWGGVDPDSGRIIEKRHRWRGTSVAGRIIVVGHSSGSSSGSSVLLELMSNGNAPAGIILGVADQILTLGAIVAREMGFGRIPVVQLEPVRFQCLPGAVHIRENGSIHPL